MFKKFAGATLIAFVAATTVGVPASAAPAQAAAPAAVEGFTLVKSTSGSGRTLRLWRNNSNGKIHGNASGAGYGDQLSIGNCCYPYTTYETVTANGNTELNTGEYAGGPNVGLKFAEGGGLSLSS